MNAFASSSRIYRLIMVGILLSFCFISCKRYDDGPLFSFRSAEARVENDWAASLVSRNEIQETQFYCRYELSLGEDKAFDWTVLTANTPEDQTQIFQGTWNLIDKQQIRLEFTSEETPTPDTENVLMEITRLKEKDMRVNFLINGDRFFLHLEPLGSFTTDSTRCAQ
ncbi:MAG: hypothetical protein AAF694_26965 [Bacteroidota bacterium]